MNHWLLPARFYLMLTGLAFWSPWLFWNRIGARGAELRACCIVDGSFSSWRFAYMFACGPADDFDSWTPVVEGSPHYIRNERQDAAGGPHNAGQKLLFWSFFMGRFSCWLRVVLWFTESLPWSLGWVRYISLCACGTALLLIGNFMIHIYMGVFCRTRRVYSVTAGVSLAFAKRYHPGWYKRDRRTSRPLEMTSVGRKVNYRRAD